MHSSKLLTKYEKKIYSSKFFSFIAGVVDTAEKHSFAKISAQPRKARPKILMRLSEQSLDLVNVFKEASKNL
jgi:hypothetical protein